MIGGNPAQLMAEAAALRTRLKAAKRLGGLAVEAALIALPKRAAATRTYLMAIAVELEAL